MQNFSNVEEFSIKRKKWLYELMEYIVVTNVIYNRSEEQRNDLRIKMDDIFNFYSVQDFILGIISNSQDKDIESKGVLLKYYNDFSLKMGFNSSDEFEMVKIKNKELKKKLADTNDEKEQYKIAQEILANYPNEVRDSAYGRFVECVFYLASDEKEKAKEKELELMRKNPEVALKYQEIKNNLSLLDDTEYMASLITDLLSQLIQENLYK